MRISFPCFTETTVVDISGGGLRGLKSIKKTTTHSNILMTIKFEDINSKTFEVYSSSPLPQEVNNCTNTENIPLGKTETESIAKLPNALATVVKNDLDTNERLVKEGLQNTNKYIKKYEDKATAGDYLPGRK